MIGYLRDQLTSLDLVPLASREGFGGLQGATAVHLFGIKPAPRNVVPIKVDAGPSVREANLEAAGLRDGFVLDVGSTSRRFTRESCLAP